VDVIPGQIAFKCLRFSEFLADIVRFVN